MIIKVLNTLGVYTSEERARLIDIEQTEEVLVSAPTAGPVQSFSKPQNLQYCTVHCKLTGRICFVSSKCFVPFPIAFVRVCRERSAPVGSSRDAAACGSVRVHRSDLHSVRQRSPDSARASRPTRGHQKRSGRTRSGRRR